MRCSSSSSRRQDGLPAGGREEQRLLRITRTARGFAKEFWSGSLRTLLGGVQ